ncbi:ankyrin [Zopfia rhizophila CBS 207.26]|uniref:Ankyrin n=1 Tax=Zopfia rhizophila CBS 207.26 TaxID=1314779 RepID=A0A6A6DV54_9PEZI|nr:ankyrin [Zopfia rhizophila CBS 207.26]
MPFVRPYLEQCLKEGRTARLPRLNVIRTVAERLAVEDGDETRVESYTSCLLELASTTGGQDVRLLLAKGPGIWERERSDYDLLAAAVFTNHISLVKSLVDSELGWQFNTIGNPFKVAVLTRRFEILDLFFADIYRYRVSSGRYYMLEIAAREGDSKMVEYLLKPGRNPFDYDSVMNEQVKEANKALRTPSVETLNLILAEREKWNPRPLSEGFLLDLLCEAARQGWTTMTEHLISLGAPLEVPIKMKSIKSPLYYACEAGHDEVINVLLDHGAQICGRELEAAASHGYTTTVKILLERGADVHCTGAEDCLLVAARKGFFEIVRILLDAGMNANQRSPAPIIFAVQSEHTGIFWLLIERGARLDEAKVAAEAVRRAEAAGLESMLSLLRSHMRTD